MSQSVRGWNASEVMSSPILAVFCNLPWNCQDVLGQDMATSTVQAPNCFCNEHKAMIEIQPEWALLLGRNQHEQMCRMAVTDAQTG